MPLVANNCLLFLGYRVLRLFRNFCFHSGVIDDATFADGTFSWDLDVAFNGEAFAAFDAFDAGADGGFGLYANEFFVS